MVLPDNNRATSPSREWQLTERPAINADTISRKP
jgi:hypothetical protein